MREKYIGFGEQRRLFWETLDTLRKFQRSELKNYPDMFGNETYQVNNRNIRGPFESWYDDSFRD